jgi:uncharacterized membrane protein YtjA (UPF0391 family)
MLRRAVIFLLIALLGASRSQLLGIAKLPFFLFMMMGLIFFILCTWHGEQSHHSGRRQANQATRSLSSSDPNMIA